ncbi:MAG: hypothetical protein ACFFE8_13860 [Candidatus Heimdallarchaeota archaeon]
MVSLSSPTRQAEYLYLLFLLHTYKHMGRYRLAWYLQTSDARIRTLLGKLVLRGLVEKAGKRVGHQLSDKGEVLWANLQQVLYIPDPTKRFHLGSRYTVGTKDALVGVEGTEEIYFNTVILRDESLINGAMGCTVFLRNETGNIYLLDAVYPPLPKHPLSDQKTVKKLNRMLIETEWKQTILVVGTANTVIGAQIGAIASAMLLIPEKYKLGIY